MKNLFLISCCSVLLTSPVFAQAASSAEEPALTQENLSNPFANAESVLLLLDCSKAMAQKIDNGSGGTTQYEQAKIAIRQLAKALPKQVKCGLMVFGSNPPSNYFESCRDIKLILPFTTDRKELRAQMDALQPTGTSCLIAAILKSETDLLEEKNTLLLVVTGEKDGTGQTVENLYRIPSDRLLRKITIYSTASNLKTEGPLQDLRTLARKTEGAYYGRNDLKNLIEAATAVKRR